MNHDEPAVLCSYKLKTQITKATLHRWQINPLQTDHELPGDWSCHLRMQGRWEKICLWWKDNPPPWPRRQQPHISEKAILAQAHTYRSTAEVCSIILCPAHPQRDPSAWLWWLLLDRDTAVAQGTNPDSQEESGQWQTCWEGWTDRHQPLTREDQRQFFGLSLRRYFLSNVQ